MAPIRIVSRTILSQYILVIPWYASSTSKHATLTPIHDHLTMCYSLNVGVNLIALPTVEPPGPALLSMHRKVPRSSAPISPYSWFTIVSLVHHLYPALVRALDLHVDYCYNESDQLFAIIPKAHM